MHPRVSVIIPCFNQGHFLLEAVESLNGCDRDLFELIIVNDGSTDPNTNEVCRDLLDKGLHVIFQENKGLAGARNAALSVAKGEFILPLDADNKLRCNYITKGLEIMDNLPEVAVVYGNAAYFGEKTGIWAPGTFNLQKLMIGNYIDACALIRRKVMNEVGLYDTGMKYMGWEDWDMWLKISFAGHKMYYLNETVFDYRVLTNSMSKTLYRQYEKPNSLENYVNAKYSDRMGQQLIWDHVTTRFKKSPIQFLIKLFIRSYFPSYYSKLLREHKIRNGI